MMKLRTRTVLALSVCTALVSAASAPAQVDWSDLFPEEGGKPAAKAQPAPAPQPQRAATAAQPKAPVATVSQAPSSARPVAKPVAKAHSAPIRRAATSKPSRRVAKPRLQKDDREFPSAAAGSSAPRLNRQAAARRSSPPPARIEEAKATAAPEAKIEPAPRIVEAEVVPAKTEPVAVKPEVVAAQPAAEPEQIAAAPQPVAAPAPIKKVEPPVVRESAPAVLPAAEPPPLAPAAKRAKAEPVVAEPAPARAPIQVAAAPAEAAMLVANHNSAPRGASGGGLVPVEPGTVITDKNMDQYPDVLTPGLEWAIRYGLRMKVIEPRRIELFREYREATEKYSGQAKLSPDGRRVLNYTAGQPFPNIDSNDPQAALKIMWNYDYRSQITDDLNAQNFDADTGSFSKNRGLAVERHYLIDYLRRLNYTGRLFVDPKPSLPNPDDVRFKESLHPLSEPFDLKGVGATFYRYNDADRQDDSWLYLPQLRRVRRLSSAQRSDALFGQDTDIDSYYGYNGHIGWADWKLLGERTVMAVMHGQNVPVKWQEPEDWVFDDAWEPRQVYVIEANSKLPQYAYGKRILYLDKQTWLVTNSDIYDRAGQLWKVWINDHSFKKEAIPGAKVSHYADEMAFVHALVMLDTQLVHATKAALPSTHTPNEECIYLNFGAKSGTSEDFFTVANLISSGH